MVENERLHDRFEEAKEITARASCPKWMVGSTVQGAAGGAVGQRKSAGIYGGVKTSKFDEGA